MRGSFGRIFSLLLTLSVGVCCAQTRLAVTFDDLPAHGAHPPAETRLDIIQSILRTLRNQQMPPVYGFVNGVRTEEHPETMAVLQAWRAAGQQLGNHTWSHPNLATTAAYPFEADIEANQPLLRSLAGGTDWHWFRYPFLQEGETVEKHRAIRAWLKGNGYRVAEVTMDFEDYLWNEPYTRCMAKNDEAALRELHDSYLQAADRYATYYRTLSQTVYGREIPFVLLMHVGALDARMLPELLELYRRRGFHFVSLEEAETDPVYANDPEIGDVDGAGLTEMVAKQRGIAIPAAPGKPMARLSAMCR